MNEPSPLVPQGSMLEQKNQGRAKFKLAVFCVIGVHVIGLLALLLTQGCKREQGATHSDVQSPYATADTNLPVMDPVSNVVSAVDTNLYANLSNSIVEPPPPGATTEHVIVKGDTFFDLARKYHVTMKALQEANPTVNPSKLQLNQKIVIPAPSPTAAPSNAGATTPHVDTATGGTTYKVASGDNLIKIGAKFGVSPSAIRNANNLTSDRIVVGQVLKIPAKATTPQ